MFSLVPVSDGMFTPPPAPPIVAGLEADDDVIMQRPAVGESRASQIRERVDSGHYHTPAMAGALALCLLEAGIL